MPEASYNGITGPPKPMDKLELECFDKSLSARIAFPLDLIPQTGRFFVVLVLDGLF